MVDSWYQPSNNPLQATQPAGGASHPEDGTPISLQVSQLGLPNLKHVFSGQAEEFSLEVPDIHPYTPNNRPLCQPLPPPRS